MTRTGRSNRVTLHSVAAAAGVSKSTVSRILNETPPHSDAETIRRVREAAAQLGYVRDVSAANLRRGRTMTVGLVVTRLTDAVMAMFYEEVSRLCAQSGRIALVAGTNDEPGSDRAAVESLLARGVEGVILTTARAGDDLPGDLAKAGVSFALALRSDGISPSAVGDDELGGYLATRHLLDLGHRRIAMIGGPAHASSAKGRFEGYRRALAEAGIVFDPAYVAAGGPGFASGGSAAEALMQRREPPTAIFAVNDAMAIGAMSALSKLGVSVPGDVSLVGYSDIPVAEHLPVPLTTLRVPYGQVAAQALDLLDANIPPADPIRVSPPELVIRQSTGPVSGAPSQA